MPELIQVIAIALATILMIFLSFIFVKLLKKEKDKEIEDRIIFSNESLDYEIFMKLINRKVYENKGQNFFTIFWININRFFVVEETYNKEDVENIIKQIHYHLKEILPKTAKIAYGKYPGTILVYLPKIYQENETNILAKKIKSTAELKIKVFEDIYFETSATIAYVKYPLNGQTSERLIESLSMAAYLSEKLGGTGITGYSNEMEKDRKFLDFYFEVKRAIQRKEFTLYYQPIIDVKNSEIYGYESLVRWNHPDKGTLSPKEFMPLMEQSGDINWISIWGLETVIKTNFDLKTEIPNNYSWHINISHRQLLNNKLVNEYQNTITKYRIEARKIVLEIADFQDMFEHEDALRTILKLKNIGFRIAVSVDKVDYQMLTKIEQYKIDMIKLNVKMLKDDYVTTQKYVEVISELTNKNNMKVIIESVEEKIDEDQINKYKFRYGQGFYYSKPLKKDEISTFSLKNK
ncbi:EAL domain-containing protein [Haploplasma axanthum]|uniref:Bacteriophytochrome cph2 n=1 Tax=Haploplasma axanthum TaxID=29552 RepID=A0A449BDU3_HAPAX|nr:EAL domain-containing protein [Haploplasma axanthum]VEU80621.1 Bacteriophytochrome cph2 [Haploplasma axanthum]